MFVYSQVLLEWELSMPAPEDLAGEFVIALPNTQETTRILLQLPETVPHRLLKECPREDINFLLKAVSCNTATKTSLDNLEA